MTMQRLALTCDLVEWETPTSFAARLAVRNMAGGASEFCLDMGLNWKTLTLGRASEIARLAELSGANESALQKYTVRAFGAARSRIGGETANNRSLHRTRPRACPLCLIESVEKLGFAGAFRRLDWQFVSIRSCERHHVALIQLPQAKFPIHNYDFAAVAQKHWKDVEEAARAYTHRHPTGLENYLRMRLSGWKGKSWIDKWPLPVVSKASEMLGVRIAFGLHGAISQLSEDDLHVAGGKGFGILQAGPECLRRLLLEFKAEFKCPFASHNRDLGTFFTWLSREQSVSGLGPLKDFVRDYIVDNYPVVLNSAILGRRIKYPRCFTLGSIEKQFGVRQERLIQMLAEAAPDTYDASDPPTYLTAEQVVALKEHINDTVSLNKAPQILGCSYHYAASFVKAGMLMRRHDAVNRSYLSRAELEAFVTPVYNLVSARPGPDLQPITTVCYLIRRNVVELYQCFLDRRLKSARRDPEKSGIDALLLDPGDARQALAQSPHQVDPRVTVVAKRLKVNAGALTQLVQHGDLRTYRARGSDTWHSFSYVPLEDVLRFEENFITLGRLRDELGADGHGGVLSRLRAKGVQPRFVGEHVSRIYRRDDVERALGIKLKVR